MIYQAMWDTEQIGVSGITTEARLDRPARNWQIRQSRLDFYGADATIGVRPARVIAVSDIYLTCHSILLPWRSCRKQCSSIRMAASTFLRCATCPGLFRKPVRFSLRSERLASIRVRP